MKNMNDDFSLDDVLNSALEFGSQVAECQHWKDYVGEQQVQEAWHHFLDTVPEDWREQATTHFGLGYHGRKIRS
jgi:hypothetical protein